MDIDRFNQNQNDRNGKINFLSPECVKEDSHVLILNRTAFFSFIKQKQEESLVNRFKNMLSKVGNAKKQK